MLTNECTDRCTYERKSGSLYCAMPEAGATKNYYHAMPEAGATKNHYHAMPEAGVTKIHSNNKAITVIS